VTEGVAPLGLLSKAISEDTEFLSGKPTPRCVCALLQDELDQEDWDAVHKLLVDTNRVTGADLSRFLIAQADALADQIEGMKPGEQREDLERLRSILIRCKPGALNNHRKESCGCTTRR